MTLSHVRRCPRLVSILVMLFLVAVMTALSAAEPSRAAVNPADELLRWPVKPSKIVELTAPINGIMDEINVEEMQQVKAGDVLAKMDDKVQVAEVAVHEAEVKRLTAVKAEYALRLEKITKLVTTDSASEFEKRKLELEHYSADLAVEVARAKVEQQKELLTRYKLLAPFHGEVVRIKAEKGARLNQGDVAMTLVLREPLESEMNLPLALMEQLEVGRTYTFLAEDPVDRQLTGRLKTLEQQIDPASGTFRCVFEFPNPQFKLPSGFYVRLMWPQPDAVKVER